MADPQTLALLIPAYNAAAFLPRLLKSAAEQTVPFDEILVYDDCSTDDTVSVAERLGARVVRGDVNRGCSTGKNALLHHTRCTWVHFHDADDDLLPTFVSSARAWMSGRGADVVLFPYEEIDDRTGSHIAYRTFDPVDVAEDARSFAIREQINPFCGLYRRSAILSAGGYDIDPLVLFNEDVAFHIRLAFSGLLFAADRQVLVVNRRRLDSMSAANKSRCVQAQYHVMRKTSDLPDAHYYSKHVARNLWSIAGVAGSLLDWETADAASMLAMRIAGPSAAQSTKAFRTVCLISPRVALRVREYSIRTLRPHTRRDAPSVAENLRASWKRSTAP